MFFPYSCNILASISFHLIHPISSQSQIQFTLWVLSTSGKSNTKTQTDIITTYESMLGTCPVLELELVSWQMRYILAEVKAKQKPRILQRKSVGREEKRTEKRDNIKREMQTESKRQRAASEILVFLCYSTSPFFLLGSLSRFLFPENIVFLIKYGPNLPDSLISAPARPTMPNFILLDNMVSLGPHYLN